jgi:ActR/RegA family two-component response regulator
MAKVRKRPSKQRSPAPRSAQARAYTARKRVALDRLAIPAKQLRLSEVIEGHLKRVMWATRGDVSLAATLLGLHRRTLQRLLGRMGVNARALRARLKK